MSEQLRTKTSFLLASILILNVGAAFSQDSLLHHMASEHYALMKYETEKNSFQGAGWKQIVNRVQGAQNVLIGEDHFTNEIPAFTDAVLGTADFENFVIEVDPYTTETIEHSIQKMSANERAKFNKQYGSFFSFYALKPEYSLLEKAVGKNINLLGAEQIVKYGDQIVLQKLLKDTSSIKISGLLKEMMDGSAQHFRKFRQDRSHTLYFETEEFGKDLNQLEKYELSEFSRQAIRDMRISRDIYRNNDHGKRISLIKRILVDSLDTWKEHRNLFKYGAVHMPRGESLLRIYDVGNLVANVTDAQFSNSYHIMIFGMSGMKGTPFQHFPNTPVDASKGMLASMAPFFRVIPEEAGQWYVFDMEPLRKALRTGELKPGNKLQERVIKGYDTLVIIPKVTAAGFLNEGSNY